MFDTAIVFARHVSLENAEFKYEYKSKIAVRILCMQHICSSLV